MAYVFQKAYGSLRPAERAAEEALSRMQNGTYVWVTAKRIRSVKHHRLFFAVLNLVHENLPERYGNAFPRPENLLDAMKIALGYCEPIINLQGEIVGQKPASISFHSMGQDQWQEFFDRAMDLITGHFLPEVGKDELIAEVEKLLADKRYADPDQRSAA